MAGDPNFCTAHIDFDDHGRRLSPSENLKKRLTILAASAVSLLCYEHSNDVASALRENSELELARRHDLVSAIWSLNEPPDIPRVASERRNRQSTPLLAWSARLQTVFIGFRGTNATQDVLTDLDIRQVPGINLGTRFHRGFLNSALSFRPLLSELSRKFRVVICGHSLGGGFGHNLYDTWEEAGSQGISVLTFGAPPMMVAETTGTTSVPRRGIAKVFHHIFNIDDPIPFMVNRCIAMLRDLLESTSKMAQIAIPTAWPFLKVLSSAFELWEKGRGQFAHYGCMYELLQTEGNLQAIACNAVTSSRAFPVPTIEIAMRNIHHHSMSHYNFCFRRMLVEDGIPDLAMDVPGMTSMSFVDQCLPLSELQQTCKGVMYEDRIVISANFTSQLIPFLINMQMEQPIGAEEKPQVFLKTADAIQKELKLQDCFGRFTRLQLGELRHVSLGQVARSTTFEAIRVALIIVLVRQESKALALRRQNPTAPRDFLANASPHLVVTNLSRAFTMIQEIWAEQPSTGEESQPVDRDYLPSQPEAYAPKGCTGRLRELILEMLVAINNSCPLTRCAEEKWQDSGLRRMIDVHPRVPTITATLCQAGKDLYNRSSDSQQWIHDAIRHSDEVLSAMRFCHLLVLTQLDAPSEWIMALADGKMWLRDLFAIIGILSIKVGTFLAPGVGIIMLPFLGAFIAGGYAAESWRRKRKRELGFQLNLVKSLETLGLSTSRFDCIPENIISEYIRSKKLTIDELGRTLVQGLSSAPETPASPRLKMKEFWPRWLFMVAKMGQVRNVIKRRLYVGVEGTTEAGKSELLTVLLAAPETAFSSGADIDSRTMDIQIQIQEMAALMRDALDVIIFVIPYSEMRSTRTQTFLREVGNFLATRTDPRPVRILLSKVDTLTFRRHQILQFELTLSQAKQDAIQLICNHSSLTSDSPIPSQRAVSHLGDSHVVLSSETLEDIVQPYSTHSQMSSDSLRALSDCDRNDERMISDNAKFQQLYQMAQDGRIWDIESLREWWRNLCPSSVPFSEGRVAPS
ncbi:hypothetical protein N7488_005059 [Penicillium malachiteum]|nr:hypothetical protein N7488_005059 [Penicillium malachiteum]